MNLNWRSHRLVAVKGMLLLLCGTAGVYTLVAQTNNATLTGSITDSSGLAVPDATVRATNTATGIGKSTQTDQTGRYTILNLEPGTYDVQTSHAGFNTVLRRNEVFYVGQTLTLDLALQIASVSETVEVQADSTTVIPTTESVVTRVIQTQELDNLPGINRSFTDLAALSPGVQVTGTAAVGQSTAGSISIGSTQAYETGYIVDGTVSEESFLGGQFLNFAQDWIQEFSLVSQQAPAEYGGAAGGYVNAITRSGGNEIHGRAYAFYQNASLNATPSFLPTFAPTKPPYNLERIGGMVGGPIKRNKLFYFGGYEFFHSLSSVPVNIPTQFESTAANSGVFAVPITTHLAMAKIDYQKNSTNKFTGRYNVEHDDDGNTGVGAAGSTSHTLGNSQNSINQGFLAQGRWERTISQNQLNELLFNYNDVTGYSQCNYAHLVGNYPGFPGQPGSTIGGNPTGYWAQVTYPNAGVVVGCPANTGVGTLDKHQGERSASINDTLSISSGKHDIKIGAGIDFEWITNYGVRNNYNGQYSINGTTPFTPSLSATYPISNFLVFDKGTSAGAEGTIFGPTYSFFAQDSFKVKPNVTLNMGIRYDFSTINSWMTNHWILPALPTETVANLNPINNDYSNVAPRAGVAWTPFHNGKTVLRGGLGVFYDQNHTAIQNVYWLDSIETIAAVNLNATRPFLNPYCLGSVNCSSGIPTTAVGSSGGKALNASQAVEYVLAYNLATSTLPNFNAGTYQIPSGPSFTITTPILPSGAPAPTNGGTFNIDQNIKTPGEMQVSGGIGQQFSNNFSMTADFVYIRGFQQLIARNVNITQQGTLLNPSFGAIESWGNGGTFSDKSLRVSTSYRDRRGDSAQGAYSLGWAYDNTYNSFGINSRVIAATNPFNYNVDYGPSVNDARHILNLSGIVVAPLGIQLAPVFSFTSALPYTATTTLTTPGCLSYYNQCYPVNASGVPYTKDSLRGADTISLNTRLSEKIRLGEKRSINVFIEGYNLLNRSNYGTNFQGNAQSATFQQPTALATAKRQFQIGGRFDF